MLCVQKVVFSVEYMYFYVCDRLPKVAPTTRSASMRFYDNRETATRVDALRE